MALLHIQTTPATAAIAMYEWKELMKTAGHTVPSSSDGTTHFAGSDGITGGGSGAGGLANNFAWFRLRLVNGEEFTFQRSNVNNLQWRIKHSRSDGFIVGTPGPTQTPAADDEAVFAGGGSDASPSWYNWWATEGTYKFKAAAYNTAPYGHWFTGIPIGGGPPNTAGWVYDPLVATHPSDTHKAVVHIGTTTTLWSLSNLSSETGTARGYLASAGLGAYVSLPGCYPQSNGGAQVANGGTAGSGVNPITGFDDVVPPIYLRRAAIANPGWKGIGTILLYSSTVRGSGSIMDMQDTTFRVRCFDVTVPWPIDTWEI